MRDAGMSHGERSETEWERRKQRAEAGVSTFCVLVFFFKAHSDVAGRNLQTRNSVFFGNSTALLSRNAQDQE